MNSYEDEISENASQETSETVDTTLINNSETAEETLQTTGIEDATPKLDFTLTGRRVVDLAYFFEHLKEIVNHSPFGCTLENMCIVNEIRLGFNSKLKIRCSLCNCNFDVYLDNPDRNTMDVNTCAVAGAMAIGIGHSQMEEFMGAMDIPSMSANTYAKSHEQVCDGWEKTAWQEMKEAAAEEARLAIKNGEVDKDGVPVLTVMADGAWAKRSYKAKYDSLSGVVSRSLTSFNDKELFYLNIYEVFWRGVTRRSL